MRWFVLLLVAALTAGVACSDSAETGQLMIAVQTDMEVPKDVDRFRIEIRQFGKLHFEQDYPIGPGDGHHLLPATLGLLPGGDPSKPVTIRVISRQGGRVRTLREAVTTVPTHRVALLRLPIQWLCTGQVEEPEPGRVVTTCPQDQTCIAGSCEPAEVDHDTLPDYAEGKVFGGGGADGGGRCFDTPGCFAHGSAVSVRRGDCTAPLPRERGEGVSFALVREPGEAGICGSEACLVPLDAESDAGWTRTDGGRAQLPPAVCDRLAEDEVVAVAVTTACTPKTESVPTCGPWSVVQAEASTRDAGAPADVRIAPPLPIADAGPDGHIEAGRLDGGLDARGDAAVAPRVVEPIGAEGGSVSSRDGTFTVAVPPEALADVVELSVAPAADVPEGALGPAFEVGPEGTEFLKPVTLEYEYDPAALGSVAESDVRLAAVQPDGTWQLLAGQALEPMANVVLAQTDRVSVFGIVAAPPGTCLSDADCAEGEQCEQGSCVAACVPETCTQQGAQCGTVADGCGGTLSCGSCSGDAMCISGACVAPTCDDGAINQDETDVDCGGSTCPACPDGAGCSAPSDCVSRVCTTSNICQAATCSDGVMNQDETDVDCGGSACAPCAAGASCSAGTDCQSGVCSGGICQEATCSDAVINQDETDVDCGGSCPACPDGSSCNVDADCQNNSCIGGTCQLPSCSDGVQNQDESFVDCGGVCVGCPAGSPCNTGSDCISTNCAGGICG